MDPANPRTTRHSGYALDGLNFLVAAMQAGFGAFVTVYLVGNGWPAEAVGFALTISTVTTLCSQIPAGFAIDAMRDKRHAVQVGVLGVGGAALLLALTPARLSVYLAQALQGLASSLIAPGIAAISLALVGHGAFCERVGRNARFASLGAGLTAGVMGLAGSYFDAASIFWLTAALTVPALIFAFIARHGGGAAPAGPQSEQEDEVRPSWLDVRKLLLDHRLLVFAVCIVLFFFGSAAMMPGVAARVTRQFPEFATLIEAATILLPQAIVAVISPWVARTAEWVGRRPLLLLGWGLVPVQGMMYASLPGVYALVFCQVLNGFSSAVFGVMMSVVAADLTRGTGRFNVTLGVLGMAISIGASLSTFFAGIVAAAFGGPAAFVALGLAGLAGTLLLWIGLPETRPQAAMAQ
jgi:MFS family permease